MLFPETYGDCHPVFRAGQRMKNRNHSRHFYSAAKVIQFLRKRLSTVNPEGFGNPQGFSEKHFLKVYNPEIRLKYTGISGKQNPKSGKCGLKNADKISSVLNYKRFSGKLGTDSFQAVVLGGQRIMSPARHTDPKHIPQTVFPEKYFCRIPGRICTVHNPGL